MKHLRRMAPFIVPYRWDMVGCWLTVVLPVAMELVVPRMLQYIVDEGILARSFDVILRGSLIMLGSALVGALATLAQGWFRARLSQGIAFDMRNALFAHIQSLSFADLDRMQTGQLMTRLSSDVDVVRMFTSAGIALLLRALLMIIGAVIMLVLTDLQLSLAIFVMLGLAALIIRAIITRATPLYSLVQQRLSALNTVLQENLAGVQVVKAFARERFEIDRFNRYNDEYMGQTIKVGRLLALAIPSLGIVTNVGLVAVAWWGGHDVIGGRISVGQLVAFNNYLLIGMAPLLLLSNMLNSISRAEASSERILEVLDTQPAIRSAAQPHTPASVQGEVAFQNVVFRYDAAPPEPVAAPAPLSAMHKARQENGAESRDSHAQHAHAMMAAAQPGQDGAPLAQNGTGGRAVLDHIHFTAKPGQRIALLGATGSGKSTLVHLIPRLYEADEGAVLVDGVDVRQWQPRDLRKHTGVVLQQNTLFSGTVRQNIAFGRPDAPLEEVMAAAKIAQAHDFIMAMPQGYDSVVEARGANLSGGQKQRIAIARALLMQPAILILDDCTSAVDMDTEFRIQEELEKLPQRATTFIVAQRISSVLNADQILILEDGQITASGTHQELLVTSPVYQEICRSQFGSVITGEQPSGDAATPASLSDRRASA